MIRRLLLLAGLCAACCTTATAETAAVREIIMDGDSSDFAEDEALFTDLQELDFDSWWGENNDINQVKVTWDDSTLYLAVDGRCWDNNIMVFFDTDSTRGIRKQDLLNSWARKLEFFDRLPEFFLGTWDGATWPDAPQFWKLKPGSTREVEQLNNSGENPLYRGASRFSQGQTGVSMEAAIPWRVFYPQFELDGIPVNAEIALVAVLVTGADHGSGPDSAPNSVLDMPQNSGDLAVIDNFAIIHLDRDGDTKPDVGISPNATEGDSLSDIPPLEFLYPPDAPRKELRFIELKALRGAFSPNGDGIEDAAEIRFIISTTNIVTITVHDMLGRKIETLAFDRRYAGEEAQFVSWDGRDNEGHLVEAGIYYLRFETGRTERKNLPVAVLR